MMLLFEFIVYTLVVSSVSFVKAEVFLFLFHVFYNKCFLCCFSVYRSCLVLNVNLYFVICLQKPYRCFCAIFPSPHFFYVRNFSLCPIEENKSPSTIACSLRFYCKHHILLYLHSQSPNLQRYAVSFPKLFFLFHTPTLLYFLRNFRFGKCISPRCAYLLSIQKRERKSALFDQSFFSVSAATAGFSSCVSSRLRI